MTPTPPSAALRANVEALLRKLLGCEHNDDIPPDDLEAALAFAADVRDEALEEAAKIVAPYELVKGPAAAKRIRARRSKASP